MSMCAVIVYRWLKKSLIPLLDFAFAERKKNMYALGGEWQDSCHWLSVYMLAGAM